MNKGFKIIIMQLSFFCIISALALPSNSTTEVIESSLNNEFSGNIAASGAGTEVNAGIQAVNTSINNSKINNVNTGGTFSASGGSKIYAGVTVDNSNGGRGLINNADISVNSSNADLKAQNGGKIYTGVYGRNIQNNGDKVELKAKLAGAGKKVIANQRNIYLGSITGDNIDANASTEVNLSEYNSNGRVNSLSDAAARDNLSIGAVDFNRTNQALTNNWEDRLNTNRNVEIGTVKVDGYNSNLKDIDVKVGKNSMNFGESVMARNRAKRSSGTLPMGEEYVYVSKNEVSKSLGSSNRRENISIGNKTIGRHSRAERVKVYVE